MPIKFKPVYDGGLGIMVQEAIPIGRRRKRRIRKRK
jgi:hypothetical protein